MTETSSLLQAGAPPATSTRRTSLRVALWLVIFLSGTVVGAGTTVLVIRDQVLTSIHHPEDMPARLARQLQRILDLDQQQAVQVERIFRQRQQALQELRRDVQPRIEREIDLAAEQVSEVLRPDQRAKWQARFRELRAKWLPALPRMVSR
jgi:hypothetical protein